MRKIDLSYQKNVRDLGGLVGFNGKKVKEGRIYRGGFLGRVSEKDIEIINSLHLTDIIDFRGSTEFERRPDYQLDGVTFHNYPSMKEDVKAEKSKTEDSNLLWFLGDNTDGFAHMYNLYPEILLDDAGLKAYTKFFELLVSKDDGVFYFHCSQGKDRAGLAAYLLEIALGVSEKDARSDYLLSNKAMESKIKNLKAMLRNEPFYNKTYEKALEEVFSAKEEYLDHALEEVNKKYGSIENYIKEVLKVDINRLRALYLE